MNDFTKEELEEIVSKFQDAPGSLNMDQVWGLVLKIQSMIDNYCEQDCKHESDDYEPLYKCSKCKKHLPMCRFD